jgi:hypothetical protein
MKQTTLTYFIGTGIFALLTLSGYVLWFLAFSGAKNQALFARSEVARIEQEDAAIANAQDTLLALASDEEMLRAYFVSAEGIVPFFEELERSGEVLGSVVEVASVTGASEAGGRLTLSIRITGSFESVMKTLGSIEYGARDVRIESLTLDTVKSEEGSEPWVAAAVFSVATIEEKP